jgi:hypothetical protein
MRFKYKMLFAVVIISLLAISSVAFILQFRGGGTRFWIAVSSAHGSPTASAWTDNGTDFTASVTSPAEVVANDHQWVCTGYSVDGGVLTLAASYTFATVTAGHSIDFSWKEQFYINVSSAHGSPTASSWVDNGTDFTASVTSPADVVANDHQWVCTGYSVDGGVLTLAASYTFATVTAGHSIDFSWKEQPVGSQIKIVGKQIPPGYVMGFGVDGGLVNGMDVVLVQNSNEKASIRFTAKLSGTVTELVVFGLAFEGQPAVHIGLQEDSGGSPAGQWMNGMAVGTVRPPNSNGFITVPLPASVDITEGQVYHVVIEAAADPLNGTFALFTYQANGFAQPSNPDDPDIVWNDTRMNTLFYSGQIWQEQNKWPIFIIKYSDGRSEGQPYSLSAQWVVCGSTHVGQTIIPASNYTIAKMAFVVGLTGQPNDKLYYQVRDSSNNVLANGLFAKADQLTAQRTWIEVTLPSPVKLTAGQLYRFVLLSPGTDLGNAYYLFGHEFTYDQDYGIGYGALQHQLTSSLDGGANWGDNPDADAIFRLTNAG